MQNTSCKYTAELMQKFNYPLDPVERKHLESCNHCREAIEIRKAFLEQIPRFIPDRKELIWRQFTVHKILREQQVQSNRQINFSFTLEVILMCLLGIILLVVSQVKPNSTELLPMRKILGGVEEISMYPAVWILISILLLSGVFFIRLLKPKNK